MPINENDCAATYKVLIIGDSGVGKSAILNCLMGREFEERSRPTVGMDFVTKILEADGALIELRIWDTAGLEDFRSLTRKQFQGAQGVIVVYDVTNRTSFDNIEYWISAITHNHTPCPRLHPYEPTPFVVLANKADLTDRKNVGIMEGMKFSTKSLAFGFQEVSAKTGKNVFSVFHNLAFIITDLNHPKLMKSYHPHLIRPMGTIDDVMNSSLPVTQPASSCQKLSRSSIASLPPSKQSSRSKSTAKLFKRNKSSSSTKKIPNTKKGGTRKAQEIPQQSDKQNHDNSAGVSNYENPKHSNKTKKPSQDTENNTEKDLILCSCFRTKKRVKS